MTNAELREKHKTKRFLFVFGTQRTWLTFEQTYREIDSGWTGSIDTGMAIDLSESPMVERLCTAEEKRDIGMASDEFSGSK